MSDNSNTFKVDASKLMALVKWMTFCIGLETLFNCVFGISVSLDSKKQGLATDEHITNI